MIKRVGSLYSSSILPGKFYLTRKELILAMENDEIEGLTDIVDILEENRTDKLNKLEENRTDKLNKLEPSKAYEGAVEFGHRWLEAEPIIAKSAEYSYYYACHVMGNKRFLLGEEEIKKDPYFALKYAIYIIRGRWEEAEATFATNARSSYLYAINALNKNTSIDNPRERFLLGEEAIKKDPEYAYKYAYSILNGRWDDPKAEKTIKQDNFYYIEYKNFLSNKGVILNNY